MKKSKVLAPIDKVFIKMPKPLNDEIITTGGLKLYIAPDYNPSFHTTVTGKVYGVPKYPKGLDSEIAKKLKVGDEIAFNYQVVINREAISNSEKFTALVDEPRKKIFTNIKNWRIIVNGMPYSGKIIWMGVLLDGRGERLEGIQGTESEVDRWLSKFDFSNDVSYKYRNLISWGDNDVWQSDYGFIYAKRTPKGEIESLGDRVIMMPIEIDVTLRAKMAGEIVPPDTAILAEYTDRGKVVSGGTKSGIKKGDIVFFDRLYVEKYNFFGKNYLIIKEKRIHGIL